MRRGARSPYSSYTRHTTSPPIPPCNHPSRSCHKERRAYSNNWQMSLNVTVTLLTVRHNCIIFIDVEHSARNLAAHVQEFGLNEYPAAIKYNYVITPSRSRRTFFKSRISVDIDPSRDSEIVVVFSPPNPVLLWSHSRSTWNSIRITHWNRYTKRERLKYSTLLINI